MKFIESFDGKHRFLSNFWPAPVRLDGELYPSVEHAYQAAKTLDLTMRKALQTAPTATAAKRLGRSVPMRKDWNEVKLSVMSDLLLQKFALGSPLLEQLRATGNAELIEGNWWGDTYWGVCKGKGHNHLGHLLMRIRSQS